MIESQQDSDRGLSIAVTHVLTIGITTILIGMLLMSGSALLESEMDRSAHTSLETVGERLAGEIANVDQIADDSDDVTITADHPRTVANSQYTIEGLDGDECSSDRAPLIDEDIPCLELTSQNVDVTVHVPIVLEDDREIDGTAAGGKIEISYDGGDEITISEADQ